jgi:glycosyltransferase involved in cell wall biosynthesis
MVVPNAIDERLYRYRTDDLSAPGSPKVIGYMGTGTHDKDIMMIAQALRAVMRRSDVELQIVGGFLDPAITEFFAGLPVRYLDNKGGQEYPSFIRWMVANARWDLAIAPLDATPFTMCKSDLKFLDYSALGVAGVYSQVRPYEEGVEHLETGYLAPNSVDAWSEALERLLNDDALRDRIANKARDYVFSKRTLAHCAAEWRDTIYEFLTSGGRAASGA